MLKVKEFIRSYIPRWTVAAFVALALSLCLYLFSCLFSSFADVLNGSISLLLRFSFATVSGIAPFSLFELCLVLSLPLVVLAVVLALKHGKDRRRRARVIFSLLGVIALIFCLYLLMLAVGYRTTPLAEKMELDERAEISESELYTLTKTVRDEINRLEEQIEFLEGESRMGFGLDELSHKLSVGYGKVNEKYPFIKDYYSRVKPVVLSSVMSDMGIMGIYGFFTGEANVNISYPDYTLPYTAAHEMAHQRGVSRENEANFVAFLVCVECDDPYIKYSGYLNLYEYLASALYRTDREAYFELLSGLAENALEDLRASAKITESHKDSLINKIMDKMNDTYLKANGTEGTVSYSYVVRLAAAYYREKIN